MSENKQLIKIGGFFNLISAGLFLIWWFGIFLIMMSKTTLVEMVQDPNWIPLNVIGLFASFLFPIGFTSMYLKISKSSTNIGLIGYILTIIALIWYSGIQYYETVIWPQIVNNSDIWAKIGFSAEDQLTFSMLLMSGLVLVLGICLFTYESYRTEIFKPLELSLFALGWIIFGIGMIPLIRTIGLLLLVIGISIISFKLIKDE